MKEVMQPETPHQSESTRKLSVGPEPFQTSPYVGPVPFQEKDRDRFFGRDIEADDLACLIEANAVVLLYSQSGAGKSSLVNAQLIPMLRGDRKCEVLVARPGRPLPYMASTGVTGAGGAFVLNALHDWLNALPDWLKNSQDRAELQSLSLKDFLGAQPHQKLQPDIEALRVLVFDQFEEIFTAPYPQRSRDRQEFFRQVREALKADNLLRVLFSIREEYIASLEPYAKLLPEGFRTRFRLERLRPEKAQEAVCKPLLKPDYAEYSFDADVVKTLLEDLLTTEVKDQDDKVQTVLDDFIEPVQLGVVCEFLWQRLMERGEKVITQDLLVKSGDVNGALTEFYNSCIQRTVAETGADEGKLRRFCRFRLITEYGTRGSCLKGAEETGDLPNKALESLDRLHLIRSEWRASATWYELTHDRFISPIVKANQQWLNDKLKPDEKKKSDQLHERAVNWAADQESDDLLRNEDLETAETLLLSPYAADMGFNTELMRSYIQKSRDLAHQRKLKALKKQRAWLEGATGLVALFLVIALVGLWSAFKSNIETQVAMRKTKESVENATTSSQELLVSEAEQMYQSARLEVNRLEDEVTSVSKKKGARAAKSLQDNLNNAQAGLKTASGKLRDAINSVGAARTTHASTHNKMWLEQLTTSVPNKVSRSEALVAAFAKTPPSDTVRRAILAKYAVALDPKRRSVEAFYEALAARPLELKSHIRPVYPVVFMAKDRLISAGADGTARVWHLASGNPIMILVGHLDTIFDIAISPDGRYIGTASHDKTARIWDASDGSEVRVLKGHTGRLWSIAFSPDGHRAATAGEDTTVWIWDFKSGTKLKILPLGEIIYGVSFSPDGNFLAAIGASGVVTLFDARTLQKRSTINAHKAWAYRVVFSPDSSKLVTTSLDGTAAIHNLRSSAPAVSLDHDGAPPVMVGEAAFSHDGRRVATADHNGMIRVWDAVLGIRLLEFNGKCGAMFGVAFSPDDDALAGGCENNSVMVWSLRGKVLGDGHGPVSGLAFSPEGSLIAASGMTEQYVWDHAMGWKPPGFASRERHDTITAISFSPDGSQLAAGGPEGIITLTSRSNPMVVCGNRSEGNKILALAFASDGRHLASASGDHTLRVWDLECSNRYVDLPGHKAPINSVGFAKDGNILVSGSDDHTAILWDVAGRQPRMVFQYRDKVARADISPDGKWIAAGGGKNPIMVWNTTNSTTPVFMSSALGDDLIALHFSENGSKILAASKDGALKSWRPASQDLPEEILWTGNPVTALEFSVANNIVGFAGSDRKIRTRPLRVDLLGLLLRAHTLTGEADLTDKECKAYLGISCPIL